MEAATGWEAVVGLITVGVIGYGIYRYVEYRKANRKVRTSNTSGGNSEENRPQKH